MASDNRLRIWFTLFVLVVFCVGLTAGILIGRRMIPGPAPSMGVRGPAGIGPMGGRGGGPPPGILLQRLTRELDLTADQRSAVEGVLKTSRARVEELQREVRDQFDAEQRQLRAEIRKVLSPEQQERFDRWVEQGPRGRGPGRRR